MLDLIVVVIECILTKDESQILSRIPSDAKASDATLPSDVVVCFFHAYHRLLRGFTVDNRLWHSPTLSSLL